MPPASQYDVIIIGAGAAGLMCAIESGKRGKKVLLIDKAKKAGKKILISGGGKCNFTNLYVSSENYLSHNPHFPKSALARYSQWDFIELFSRYGLTWEEREHGQLFCEQGAEAIVNMLLEECHQYDVSFQFHCDIDRIEKKGSFELQTNQGVFSAASLVIATGGPSIPRMGSTDFGIRIAKQFGLKSIPFKPALVPFTFQPTTFKRYLKELSGISLDASVCCNEACFREQLLITHRGLSGPVVLQISSYWKKGDRINIDLLPDIDVTEWLRQQADQRPKTELKTLLSEKLPRRLVVRLCEADLDNRPMNRYSSNELDQIGHYINHWGLEPSGTEGMRTAEAATGGVDTDELSSKTFEAKSVPGLYFIGETVDVTGHLGGFNFQWAWASGWCAGQYA